MTDIQGMGLIGTGLVLLIAVGTLLFKGGKWVGRADERLGTLTSLVGEIRQDIKSLLSRMSPPTVAVDSPLRLTELGEKISAALGAAAWADETADSLHDQVIGKRPDQVQQLCFDYIFNDFRPSEQLETAISVSGYEHGINKEQVLSVLAVVLRDKLSGALEAPARRVAS